MSPLIIDSGRNDFGLTLLLPRSQQRAHPVSSLHSGNCRFCGFSFASWESLESHFQSSRTGTSCTPLVSKGSFNPLRLVHELAIPDDRTTMGTVIQPRQTAIESNAQIPAIIETSRWSVILESQRATTLAALTASCHFYSRLAKNNYKLGPGHATPVGVNVTPSLLPLPTPTHNPQAPKRGAVALDCDMVGLARGKSEVARIFALDVLTGQVLMGTLVQATQQVTAWRTKYSGITRKAMATAVAENRVLKGWPAARAELWKYMDSNTVLVGHALNHNLEELRMQHGRVVDSRILAKDAVGHGVNRQL